MDLSTCELNWHITNAELEQMTDECVGCSSPSYNTPSLIQTADGDKVILFSFKSKEKPGWALGDKNYQGCYIAALHVTDGSLRYKSVIVDKHARDAAICIIHGVQIEGRYAYGGVSSH